VPGWARAQVSGFSRPGQLNKKSAASFGKDIWYLPLGAAYSTTITSGLDGQQYVVIPTGSTLLGFAFP
jgi:hypothetical protein